MFVNFANLFTQRAPNNEDMVIDVDVYKVTWLLQEAEVICDSAITS